jgi:bifunctional N-acetylglucosamine-1-phosphate-uridyltransferase/glucosamine-1-phosphate-acetyltransferase GlmU-like protein
MTNAALILAAGLGTRMRSQLPKAMHPIAGRPMLQHLLDAVGQVFDRAVVVVGPGMEDLAGIAAPHGVVVQTERLGTGHAALQAAVNSKEGLVLATSIAKESCALIRSLRWVSFRLAGPEALRARSRSPMSLIYP